MDVSVQELEAAINYWRDMQPAYGKEFALSTPVKRLATVYALMIYRGAHSLPLASLDGADLQLLETWRRNQAHAR